MTAPTMQGSLANADRRAALLAHRFALSVDVPRRFFPSHADAISRACLAMAQRFERGGRLLVVGEGAQASDAEHVAVEFVHPVLVGKRALPALALPGDASSLLARLATLGQPHDILMTLDLDGHGHAACAALGAARSAGMLTIALTGADGGALRRDDMAEHLFVVDATDALVIQETHETLYHVLWELVHLFFAPRVAE